MSYVFVADDFTGASDTLATLARGGCATRLFLDLPAPSDIAGLDAWGIATPARALGRPAMAALAARLGAGLAAGAPRFLHVKVCSTFDSSDATGNIALLAQGLADAAGIRDLAVIGGQPSLGRYAVFGTLFAAAPDGAVHRLDRHPVMSRHPVTPMHEADLLRHLAAIGLHGLTRVGGGAAGGAFPRFYDALSQQDIAAAGRDLARAPGPVVVVGASSVAEAWLAARPRPARGAAAPAKGLPPLTGPVLGFAGSRSSLTTAQVAAADGIARLPVNPRDMLEGGAACAAADRWARERLARGLDCILYLTADHLGQIDPAELARRSAEFVAGLFGCTDAGALVVAGGDTSSAIVARLAPDWLRHAGEVCAGVPILSARRGGRELPMVLKGGQMGGPDFFARAIDALRPCPVAARPRA
ncbi:four-carbon acid sugar kinase family protein [Frigidibacter sp. MR17.24]|uniref:four-carbon acid sugar kinase family protein n=1 Tax=Frigidibacter sp. MR17.24 TaxID=3127345 RepID=UPI003012C4E3